MKILPVSYTQNNNRYKISFNAKLNRKLISTINQQTINKIHRVGQQYSIAGKRYTQEDIIGIILEKSAIIDNLKSFAARFQDDFELRLMSKVDKGTGEKNVFFVLTHPKADKKIKKVSFVCFDEKDISLDSIREASNEMVNDKLSQSYIEDVHRHFKNYIIDAAEEQVRNNYRRGLIKELADYIAEFSQFTQFTHNGENNRDYVLNLLKAVHSEQVKREHDQQRLEQIAEANSNLTKNFLGNIVS